MQKTLLATALALASLTAYAADYYVVVPLQGKATTQANITVDLLPATLPAAKVNAPYSFDANTALTVTGDPSYNPSHVVWAITSGALPPGITLDSKGVVSGRALTENATGAQFNLRARYLAREDTQAYVLAVDPALAIDIVAHGAGRRWSNGTYAPSCQAYLAAQSGYEYAGAVGSGVYSLDPDGAGSLAPFEAYCDMTTDGGGWALVGNYGRNASSNLDFLEGSNQAAAVNPASPVGTAGGTIGMNRWGNAFGFNRAKIEFIAGDNAGQVATFYKSITKANVDAWSVAGATEPNATATCTNLALSANCTTRGFDHDYFGSQGGTLILWGVTVAKYGFSADASIDVHGALHLRASNLGSAYEGFCSVTADRNGNAWGDSYADGHWGNGLRIWMR